MNQRFSAFLFVFLFYAATLTNCDRKTGTVTLLPPINESGSAIRPEQIADRQLLAEYQAAFPTYTDLPRNSPPAADNTFEQIVDRQALARYQLTLTLSNPE